MPGWAWAGVLGLRGRVRAAARGGGGLLRRDPDAGDRVRHVLRQRRADLGALVRADGGGGRPRRLRPTALGFVGGAVVYTAANVVLSKHGAKHRKRSGKQQPSDAESGIAIVLGALLDGIPESVVVGVSLLGGGTVSVAAVVAIFLSNVPEGLSGTAPASPHANRSPSMGLRGSRGGLIAVRSS